MKVSEFRDQIKTWENEGKLNNQTIEFIVDAKKYFPKDIKAGIDTMTFTITRDQYNPFPAAELKAALEKVNSNIDIQINQNGNDKSIEQIYLSANFIEIVLN